MARCFPSASAPSASASLLASAAEQRASPRGCALLISSGQKPESISRWCRQVLINQDLHAPWLRTLALTSRSVIHRGSFPAVKLCSLGCLPSDRQQAAGLPCRTPQRCKRSAGGIAVRLSELTLGRHHRDSCSAFSVCLFSSSSPLSQRGREICTGLGKPPRSAGVARRSRLDAAPSSQASARGVRADLAPLRSGVGIPLSGGRLSSRIGRLDGELGNPKSGHGD